jgi:MFS-type transporter involved in bile tolerance (Atg22 family)
MHLNRTNFLILLAVPGVAHAQQISPLIAALAVSPILVLLLALILGVVSRSWQVAAKHAGLVVVWVVLFAIASYWVENDYIIWTPLVLYAAHATIMLLLVIRGLIRRYTG